MPTLTIRNLPASTVATLKELAARNGRSMEQEVRDLLDGYAAERQSVLRQVEESWARQTRRPKAEEIDRWMGVGRP